MDKIEILMALGENNRERSKVDPKKQLGPIYREIRDLKSAILAAEKQLSHMAREYQEKKEELDQLLLDVPKWTADIAKAKERMIRQRGLSLKDMLEIQQEVAKAEENQLLGEAKAIDLQNKLTAYTKEKSIAQARIKELKAQFNQRATIYNQEKAKADLQMASFAAKEEELMEGLDPETAALYQDAIRSNPDNPVVILEKDICGGCRIGLSKHMVKLVNHGDKLICCENCMRILLPSHKGAKE